MPQKTKSSSELLMDFKKKIAQIEALRGPLDDLIESRENKSYLNYLASSYGEAAWWKKGILFIGFTGIFAAGIYFLGVSPFWMVPVMTAYFLCTFFLSNHHESNQAINTKTVGVLEKILAESIDSIDDLSKQLSAMTNGCSVLYQFQKTEHIAFKQQLTSMEGSNVAYKKAVETLEPLVHDLNEAEQMANQKSKMLLKVLDETHAALSEEQRTITQMLTPKLDKTIHSLEDSGAHFASLKTQFQKNIVHMNAFVDELDALCFQLESEHEAEKASHATASEKTKRLLSHADDAIEQAMRLLKQSPGGEEGEANGVSTATNTAFFRAAPIIPSGGEGRAVLNATQ